MTKPATILEWATDDIFPAGGDPWSSQPNKVEPPAGKIDTGRVPTELPPSVETNWWRSMVSRFIEHLLSFRLLNWHNDISVSAVAATGAPGPGCYDESTGMLSIGTDDGETIESPTGIIWDDEGGGGVAGPWVGMGAIVDMDSDDHGRRCCVGSYTTDRISTKIVAGSWASCTITGAPALTFDRIVSDSDAGGGGVALWLATDQSTPTAFYRSTTGTTFAAVVVPGWTGTRPALVASKDPANDVVLAMNGTQVAMCSDHLGLVWTVSAHGLNITNPSGTYRQQFVAYDKARSRFVAILGGLSAGDIAYSEDNGATWTTLTGVLPAWGTGDIQLVASRDGELFAHLADSGFHASVDGGVSWKPVEVEPGASGGAGIGGGRMTFGAGRCVMAGGTTTTASGLHVSLRAEA